MINKGGHYLQFNTYKTKFATLLLSSLLLLATTPTVSASEEAVDGEIEAVEERESIVDADETASDMLTFSAVGEDLKATEDLSRPDEADSIEEEEPLEQEPDVPEESEAPEEVEPQPEPAPNVPVAPEIPDTSETPETPVEAEPIPEPIPEPTIDPVLEPNPIEPNAATVSGVANPGAHVIVEYPGTTHQRATTVNADGSWLIRNVGGDRAYLTEDAIVPMNLQLRDNGQELTYSYAFQVGDAAATDLIEESQMVYVSNETEAASDPTHPSTTAESSSTLVDEEQELLPPTGEEDNVDFFAFASIVSGIGLIFVDKKKNRLRM